MRCFIFFIISCFSFPVFANDFPVPSLWAKTSENGIDIFTGNIFMTYVKKKTKGKYLLIHDTEQHGLVCGLLPDDNLYLCSPTVLTRPVVSDKDRIDKISEGTDTAQSVYLKINFNSDELSMEMAPLFSCPNAGDCSYEELPHYKLIQQEKRKTK